MLKIFQGIFGAIVAVFGWAKHRSELKNAPDVKQAQVNQDEVNAVSKSESAVEKKDVTAIRDELAE